MEANPKKLQFKPNTRWHTIAGLGLTAIYLGAVAAYVWWKWADIPKMPPNEMGDLLAGAFGPLAVAWFVVGYFQQGAELQQNTLALQMQAEELANSVAEQRQLVELTKAQLDEEIAHRKREEEKEELRSRPELTKPKIKYLGDDYYRIEFSNTGPPCKVLDVVFTSAKIEKIGLDVPNELMPDSVVQMNVRVERGVQPEHISYMRVQTLTKLQKELVIEFLVTSHPLRADELWVSEISLPIIDERFRFLSEQKSPY